MTICMTNGGIYSDVITINDKRVSDVKLVALIETLTNDKFITVSFNNGTKKAILRTSCISSINFKEHP